MNILIPIAPATKKNSNQIVKVRGRYMVIPSAKYKKYEKECGKYLPTLDEPINYPVNVCCTYYMPTRRRVDLVNLEEATLDILVKYKVIADDNSSVVVSMDGSRVFYDKDNARAEITITAINEVTNV